MTFLKRKWSDFEKWSMGIFAVLIGAAIIALFSYEKPVSNHNISYLTGYDAAIALALANKGDDITRIKSKIDFRLTKLNVGKLEYPSEPNKDGGLMVAEFVNDLRGSLSAQDKALECAFLTGFAGFVETNTPGTFPSFDLKKSASCAGFPIRDDLGAKEYLLWLYRRTGEELEYQ